MVVGRLKEVSNVKLVMKYCYQWKALENTQDRIQFRGRDDHLLLIKLSVEGVLCLASQNHFVNPSSQTLQVQSSELHCP